MINIADLTPRWSVSQCSFVVPFMKFPVLLVSPPATIQVPSAKPVEAAYATFSWNSILWPDLWDSSCIEHWKSVCKIDKLGAFWPHKIEVLVDTNILLINWLKISHVSLPLFPSPRILGPVPVVLVESEAVVFVLILVLLLGGISIQFECFQPKRNTVRTLQTCQKYSRKLSGWFFQMHYPNIPIGHIWPQI